MHVELLKLGKTNRSSSSTKRLAKMNEHECESDEDCEVYFLKPVNEYNIVDKIKEANKQLFADAEDENEKLATDAENGATNRKVTFALNLEDYEPSADGDGTLKTNCTDTVEEVDELQLKLLADFKFPPIDEEEPTALDENDAAEPQTLGEQTDTNVSMDENSSPEPDPIKNTKMQADVEETHHSMKRSTENEDDVEEICEEIVVMDMEENGETVLTTTHTAVSNSAHPNQRRICKQATFDYDEDQSDNKSLTNLLTSDDEEEFCANGDNDGDEEDDDDEDDNLSIIVASYIPDDYDNASITSDNEERTTTTTTTTDRSYSASRKSKRFFNRRFSFRRKAATTSGSSGKHIMPPPEVTDLKLNYKTCCEYRNAVQEKLPKYTGYLSEYGLSREQLARRNEKLQQKQRSVLTATLKANDDELSKMQDNERAFTRWLRNKIRFPINKTRNMFDVKKIGMNVWGGGGRGSCNASRNHVCSGNINY